MFKITLSIFILLIMPFLAAAGSLEDASKYTVQVKTSISHPFAEDNAGTFDGAGFVVDKTNRYIITNAHVSGHGNARIRIAFEDYEYEDATAVYVDPVLDLAVLQVDNTELPDDIIEATLDCSGRYINGVDVAAYGHPHGLAFSASRGIVSKVRTYQTNDWVQTDAAINPGNSGGPLIDIKSSKVIGVNAMGFENTQGLNFAIPMRPVCSILSLLREAKDPSPPAFPMTFAANNILDEHLTISGNMYGPLPSNIQQGDIITSINGEDVYTPNDVFEELRAFAGKAEVGIKRANKTLIETVNITPQPTKLSRNFILMDGALIARDVYPERWFREGLFQIHSIAQGSEVEQSPLKTYQLIVAVNGSKPISIEHLFELLNSGKENKMILREWSSRDNFLYDFQYVNYEPGNVTLNIND